VKRWLIGDKAYDRWVGIFYASSGVDIGTLAIQFLGCAKSMIRFLWKWQI